MKIEIQIHCAKCGCELPWSLKKSSESGSLQLLNASPCTYCQGDDGKRVAQLEKRNEQLEATVAKMEVALTKVKSEQLKW